MFSDEIRSVMAALGVLAGKIGEEEWALVRMARHNLGAYRLLKVKFRFPCRKRSRA